MKQYLINPFELIAGRKSMFFGLVSASCTIVVAYYAHVHFPDLLSFKYIGQISMTNLGIETLVNWLVLSCVLYVSAVVLGKKHTRISDLFGTQLLARIPYLFATLTGFSDAPIRFSQYLMHALMDLGDPVALRAWDIPLTIIQLGFTLLMTIWMVRLMFQSYKVSTNLKSTKLILSFVLAFILAIGISTVVNAKLLGLGLGFVSPDLLLK